MYIYGIFLSFSVYPFCTAKTMINTNYHSERERESCGKECLKNEETENITTLVKRHVVLENIEHRTSSKSQFVVVV